MELCIRLEESCLMGCDVACTGVTFQQTVDSINKYKYSSDAYGLDGLATIPSIIFSLFSSTYTAPLGTTQPPISSDFSGGKEAEA
jgi:hypothetical protein